MNTTSHIYRIGLVIGLVVLFGVAAFFYRSDKVTTQWQDTAPTETPITQDVRPENMTLSGVYVGCLPKQDNFSSENCIEGIRADDEAYYVLDLNMLAEKPMLKANEKITVTGTFTPVELLNSTYVQETRAKGIFSVTKITTDEPVVTKPTQPATTTKPAAGKCYVGGCSAEVCSDRPDAVSTCIYQEKFACYQTAKCERQSNGQCGWTQTAALQTCLAK